MTVREKLENGDTQNSSPIILTKDSVMTLGWIWQLKIFHI